MVDFERKLFDAANLFFVICSDKLEICYIMQFELLIIIFLPW
jgi:hypothetical protein